MHHALKKSALSQSLAGHHTIITQERILTLLHLLLTQMPQLINTRRLPRNSTLHNLNRARHKILRTRRISHRTRLNLNQPDSRIFRSTIMFSITEVSEPSLEGGGVVLSDFGAVGFDGCGAGEGGPFARVVEESDVDLGVGVEVVGFAGFGVGVEDEVDAVAFLFEGQSSMFEVQASWKRESERALAARAIALLTRSPSVFLVVSKQNLFLSMNVFKSSTFSCSEGSCWFLEVYGSASWEPVLVLLNDMMAGVW